MMCTPGGLKIIAGTAADLATRFGVRPPLVVITDTSTRDVETARVMLETFGQPAESLVYDAAVFDSLEPDDGQPALCERGFSDEELAASVRDTSATRGGRGQGSRIDVNAVFIHLV